MPDLRCSADRPGHRDPCPRQSACRLIINADDFGGSEGVNQAVRDLHDAGIVTSASLMVTAPAAHQALELARERPGLAVGLHLALTGVPPVSPREEVAALLERSGRLRERWILTVAAVTLLSLARRALRREIEGQLKAFAALQIGFSHLDFHLHLCHTPAIFREALDLAAGYPFTGWRVPEDDYALFRSLCPGEAAGRRLEGRLLHRSCERQRRSLRESSFRLTRRCYGYYRSGRLDADYLCRLAAALPDGDHELHCHPDYSTASGEAECRALLSGSFREALRARGVALTTYPELDRERRDATPTG